MTGLGADLSYARVFLCSCVPMLVCSYARVFLCSCVPMLVCSYGGC